MQIVGPDPGPPPNFLAFLKCPGQSKSTEMQFQPQVVCLALASDGPFDGNSSLNPRKVISQSLLR